MNLVGGIVSSVLESVRMIADPAPAISRMPLSDLSGMADWKSFVRKRAQGERVYVNPNKIHQSAPDVDIEVDPEQQAKTEALIEVMSGKAMVEQFNAMLESIYPDPKKNKDKKPESEGNKEREKEKVVFGSKLFGKWKSESGKIIDVTPVKSVEKEQGVDYDPKNRRKDNENN